MKAEEVFGEYERHAGAVEAEFRRVAARFAERMQCRRGCSMCCSQMFSISLLEAAYISRAVKRLPEGEREQLRAAARAYIVRARELTGGGEEEETVTPRPGERLPCPALRGQACRPFVPTENQPG